jgi:hypothetical protein
MFVLLFLPNSSLKTVLNKLFACHLHYSSPPPSSEGLRKLYRSKERDVAVYISTFRFWVSLKISSEQIFQIPKQYRLHLYLIWLISPTEFCVFCVIFFDREVMLEKQLTGHRVDRSICAWFWDQIVSQGDSFKVLWSFDIVCWTFFAILESGFDFNLNCFLIFHDYISFFWLV